jgi:hypothetical protein
VGSVDDVREKKPFRWGFWTATLAILALVLVGQAASVALSGFGPQDAHGAADFLAGLQAKDVLFAELVLSSAVFVWLQRASVARFFRSMHVGVSLITLTALAVIVGVLVPQIENFEDPTERVASLSDVPGDVVEAYLASPKRPADEDGRLRPDDNPLLAKLAPSQALRLKSWRREYEAFRWAEGYFFYHLLHPYGLGMPAGELPPQVKDGLARFGERYGEEEQKNRSIEMKAAFSGRQKTEEIRALIERHETAIRGAFQVCSALQLNRAYKSSWFTSLLLLLAIGIAFNTFRAGPDRLLSLKKVGFFTVHMGVLTILAGGFVSRHLTDRGILHLDVTESPTDTYWAYGSSDKKTRMPFAVKADRFARKDWPTLEVGFSGDQFRSKLPEYTLWPGFEKDLDFAAGEDGVVRPRIHLKVVALAARAVVGLPRFYDAPNRDDPEGQGPLAVLDVRPESGPAQTDYLKPDYPERNALYDPAWRFRLRSSYGESPKVALAEIAAADPAVIGRLLVRSPGAGEVEPRRVPFRLGETIEVAGGYSVEITDATAQFRLDSGGKEEVHDPRPLQEQPPSRPAVWVEIRGPGGDGSERRLLLESLDWEAHGRQKNFTYKDLVLGLEWERWTCAGPPHFVLHWGKDGPTSLVAEDGTETPVVVGEPLALPGGTKVVATGIHHNVLYEKKIDLTAPPIQGPKFDSAFYAHDPTGLELEVTSYPGTSKQRVDSVRMAATNESLANFWEDSEKRFSLRFYGNDRALPFEWRSVLSIWKKDADQKLYKVDVGPEREREVRVNDYLYYEGYRFFQTNAIPELPTYSGIGVVYDPGIPVVLMGMYLTIVGTALAFLIRPIVERVRARRAVAPGTSTGGAA